MSEVPLLAGRYRYVRELGRGAKGRVIEVFDVQTQASLAAKSVEPDSFSWLMVELDALQQLAHPSLVRVHELLRVEESLPPPFGLPAETPVLVEELALGQTGVAAFLALDNESRLALALTTAYEVSLALAALHGVGLIHGDVKPDNVAVRVGSANPPGPAAMLLDLGLCGPATNQPSLGPFEHEEDPESRAQGLGGWHASQDRYAHHRDGHSGSGSQGTSHDVRGTPGYLAPEAWRGARSVASDLYALGVSLRQWVGGAVARSRDGQTEPELHRADETAALLSESPLDRLVARLCEVDATARPRTARDAATIIAAEARELGIELPPMPTAPSPAERAVAAANVPWVGDAGALADLVERLDSGLDRAFIGRLRDGAAPRAANEERGAEDPNIEASVPATERPQGPKSWLVRVSGAPGSGRSRFIVEASRRLQRRSASSHRRIPTYVRVESPWGSDAPVLTSTEAHTGAPVIWHVPASAVTGGASSPNALEVEDHARRLVRMTRVGGRPSVVVLETSVDDAAPDLRIAPLDTDQLRLLLEHLGMPSPSARLLRAARSASGGLAGRLCRQVAAVWREGGDPSRAEELQATAGLDDESPLRWSPTTASSALRLALFGGSAPPEALGEARAALASLVANGDAFVARNGRIELRRDHCVRLRARDTPKRRAALAQSLQPFDATSAAYLAAHRGSADADRLMAAQVGALRLRGQLRSAEEILQDARAVLAPAPWMTDAAYRILLAQGRYDQAADAAPNTACKAEALRRAGRTVEAGHILSALADEEAPLTRGWLALGAGDVRAAKRYARAADSAELTAWALLTEGELEQAEVAVSGALRLGGESMDGPVRARLLSTLGSVLHVAGRGLEASEAHREARALAARHGERHLEATAFGNLGATLLDAGDLGSALRVLEKGACALIGLGRDRDVARALANSAAAGLYVGDEALASVWVDEASAAAERAGDEPARHHIEGLQAELALRRGDIAAARVHARRATADASMLPRMAALLAHLDPRWARRLRVPGNNFETRLAYARCRLALGELSEAAQVAGTLVPRGWTERLETRLLALDVATAREDGQAARLAAAEARALLDRAARDLPPDRRARLRAVPRHQRVLGVAIDDTNDTATDRSRWRRLGSLAKRLNAEREPQQLRALVVDCALSLIDAERAMLVRRKGDGTLQVLARAGIGAADEPSLSVVARALESRSAVASRDALQDARLHGSASVHAMALRSVLCVPLRDRPEVLYLDDRLRPGVFRDDERMLARDLSDIAAIAIEGAELLRRERSAATRLARMNYQLEARVAVQEQELRHLRRDGGDLIAVSPSMRRCVELVDRVAAADVAVLLQGESGTGKELLARRLHRSGARSEGPFVAESCVALPEGLVESLLFGHTKGAFTGAHSDHAGLFEVADGGTLFLDEIAEMSLGLQAKLLRVLQEGEIRPVGSPDMRSVDVRLVTATHRPLEAWVREGRFREDLYYRVAALRIEVPPLRERPADIEALAHHFLAVTREGEAAAELTPEALQALRAHSWPGNVRELENAIRRARVLCADGHITPEHLSSAIGGPSLDPLDLKGQVAQLEERLVREALAHTDGNRTHAAELLGLSRYGLQKMLKRLAVTD